MANSQQLIEVLTATDPFGLAVYVAIVNLIPNQHKKAITREVIEEVTDISLPVITKKIKTLMDEGFIDRQKSTEDRYFDYVLK